MIERGTSIRRRGGFSLTELMICVALIGVLAAIGFPVFARYQLKAKSSEAKTNLAALHLAEETVFAEQGVYLAANPEPPGIPGLQAAPFDFTGSDFSPIGWSPEGDVYFSYAVAITADAGGFTAEAASDLDLDTQIQIWAYKRPNGLGVAPAGPIACDSALIRPKQIEPCHLGNAVF